MYGRRGQPPPVYLNLPSCLLPSHLPSCLHFCLPAYLIFCLFVYSLTFLSSCLPFIFSAYLPSHLSANLPVYLSQPPTRHIQPDCACSPSHAPQDSERRWAVDLGVGASSQDGSPWSGGTFKTLAEKLSYLCKLNYFTANTFNYFTANIKTISS